MSSNAMTAGFAIGLAVAAPIGPIAILCIERTLTYGLFAGIATGLGAATVHTVYGATAAWGFEAVRPLLALDPTVLALSSAAILLWFAWRCLRRQISAHALVPTRSGLLWIYLTTLALGFANPLTVLLLAAAFAALMPALPPDAVPMLVFGLLLGSCVWWLALSVAVANLRHRLEPSWLTGISRFAGLALAAAAFGLVARAV